MAPGRARSAPVVKRYGLLSHSCFRRGCSSQRQVTDIWIAYLPGRQPKEKLHGDEKCISLTPHLNQGGAQGGAGRHLVDR